MRLILVLAIALSAAFILADEDTEIYIEESYQIPNTLPPIQPIPPVENTQCERSYVCDVNGINCKWIFICK